MDLETNLKSAIETAVKNAFDLDDVKDLIMIEIPRDNSFGDYSTNIAMRLAKTLHQNPKVIANIFRKYCPKNTNPLSINERIINCILPTFVNNSVKTLLSSLSVTILFTFGINTFDTDVEKLK